jgi:hypothetical protein
MSAIESLSSPAALGDLLSSELLRADGTPCVIHAGHFALVCNRDGAPVDCLNQSCFPGSDLGFAEFSRLTWETACRTVAAVRTTSQVKLMVLVNDWQFLKSKESNRSASERAKARMREDYYQSVPLLPPFHFQELIRNNLSENAVFRNQDDCWLFSESALRHQLSTVIREVMADEKRAASAGIRRYFNEDGEPVIEASDEDAGQVCLLYCGNTNCAGEIIMLLENLYRHGIRYFLNVYPAQCREPVGIGTRLARRLFDLRDLRVTNIAVSGTALGGDALRAVVERFGPED